MRISSPLPFNYAATPPASRPPHRSSQAMADSSSSVRFGQQDTFLARDLVVRLLNLVDELKTPNRNVKALALENPFKDCDLTAASALIEAYNATVPEAKRFQQDSYNPRAFKATLGGGRTLWLRLYDQNPLDKLYTNVTGPLVYIRLTIPDNRFQVIRLPLQGGRLLSVYEKWQYRQQERNNMVAETEA